MTAPPTPPATVTPSMLLRLVAERLAAALYPRAVVRIAATASGRVAAVCAAPHDTTGLAVEHARATAPAEDAALFALAVELRNRLAAYAETIARSLADADEALALVRGAVTQ